MSLVSTNLPHGVASREIGNAKGSESKDNSSGKYQRAVFQFLLRHRVWLLAAGHAVVFAVAYWLAFLLRFDFQVSEVFVRRFWITLPAVLAIKLYLFFVTGHFHGWWRYVTFSDLTALLRASFLTLGTLVILNHYAMEGHLPRAVVIVDFLVSILILGALRASWRLCREQAWFRGGEENVALMVGADHDSGVLAHQIHSHVDLPYRVVGFIDNDASRHGTHLGGMPVLGGLSSVSEVASASKVTDILVKADYLNGPEMRRLMDETDEANLRLKIVPSVADYLNGVGTIPVRDVEINDLLGREPVELDLRSIAADVENQTVLVTGAGGSIGSEICRQLIQFGPAKLVLVDNGENNLFLIHGELSRECDVPLTPYVTDVKHEEAMRNVFEQERPAYVIHAAAHKHVGLMESNVAQCVRTNVFGSKVVADLAHEFQARKFVLISTDKAVNPTSVMGASKQIAERYIHAMAQESRTAFVVVRFGNVLGSNGSVVPIFKEQIRRGGPVTVTDKRMTRFFMTIPEASQLVLQAAAMGKGGEIFVLEMGDQVLIDDLARDLIRLSGLPSNAIEIEYVGMRPGEKLYEELYFDEEQALETSHPKLRAAYHRPYSVGEVLETIEGLKPILTQNDTIVRARLKEIVPEYTPPEGSLPTSADLPV